MRLWPSACRDEDEHLGDSRHKKQQFQVWRQPHRLSSVCEIVGAEQASQFGLEKTGCDLSAALIGCFVVKYRQSVFPS